MVDVVTVKQLACALPEAADTSTDKDLGFNVAGKGFAWSWKERVAPKAPRVPRMDVLAVRCVKDFKDAILESDPEVFFTEPHYNGFPAVLVRIDKIDEARLADLLKSAWKCVPPKALVKTHDQA